MIDTLSIIPGSISMKDSLGNMFPLSNYHILPEKSLLIIDKKAMLPMQIRLQYRVYPFAFYGKYLHKNSALIPEDIKASKNPFIFSNYNNSSGQNPFQLDGLSKSGSISRGLSMGNNQDVVVNSTFNLQLSGKIGEDVEILAAISDNNIPIQPEGNTQQIQEFDKVFIQLSKNKTRLIAGDFELKKPDSYFMVYNKKLQGAALNTEILLSKNKTTPTLLELSGAGAVTKGKYARNVLNGTESNQGPYKLTGNNNDLYIVVLAGSEKVFIDGQLKVRGMDNDYVIDYNTAEITFTPKNLITKDRRLVVEFEYTDKHYTHSAFAAHAKFISPKSSISFNFFSEQDAKNQSLQPALDDNQKKLLGTIGDSLNLAVSPSIDSVAFSATDILYKRIDSLYNSITYDSVFVYSTNADSAHYQLNFSYVGAGKGNYLQLTGTANGRVFYWVAPVGNVLQGAYEPVILLVTPKKKQMYTLSGDFKLSKSTNLNIEIALSNNDINTFSDKDKKDDVGYALKAALDNKFRLSKKESNHWKMLLGLSHEWVYKNFSPIENYRPVEFNRDFNLNTQMANANEYYSQLKLAFTNDSDKTIGYQLKSLIKGGIYEGWNNMLGINYGFKGFSFKINGSLLTTKSSSVSTNFFRLDADVSKAIKWLMLGITQSMEDNAFKKGNDSLLLNSYSYKESGMYMKTSDTLKNAVELRYKHRWDYFPVNNMLTESTNSDDFSASYQLMKQRNHQLNIMGTYRSLQIKNTQTSSKPENTLIGRIEYVTRLFKEIITSSTFYEIGSGLETKKEYSFLKVPDGEGVYTWIDYNNNGIPELNEFEVALFKDQANYIKVYMQSNDYIKVYTNQFSESVTFNPLYTWASKKGFRKFLSRLYNQFSFKIDNKTTLNNLIKAYNPFEANLNDTVILSSNNSFRNTFSFNRNAKIFGFDINYQNSKNKIMLLNGFDNRKVETIGIKFKFNLFKQFLFNFEDNYSEKKTEEEYFADKNYSLYINELQSEFIYQPLNTIRLSLLYKYSNKRNIINQPNDLAEIHRGQIEINFRSVQNGNFLMKYSLISIHYNSAQNTSISYELLEGLLKGTNQLWSVSYQQNLSKNIQLNLIYDGRLSPGTKVIHTGNIQIRAFF